ncbi:hypothetical protein HYQ44_013255 [Verticillium longisporum]|nr:hypothetical protein HYQ44_013255 [Verticillium longisporum]
MDRMLLFGMIGLPKNMLEFAIPTSKKRFSTTDDLQDYHGLNMLHHACREGHIQMVELVLECTQDINRRARGTGETALLIACQGSHRTLAADNDSRSLEIADILLQADVLLERQDVRDHMKALDWAGRTVIHCSLRHPTTQLMVSKLYWASGAVEASDFFTDLINLQAQYVGLIAQFMRPS